MPPSATSKYNFCSSFKTKFFKCALSIANHNASSLNSSKGSKFVRNEPQNKTGSLKLINIFKQKNYYFNTCGIIVRTFRKLWIPIFDMSTLSIKIFPPTSSTIRNNASVIEDFPILKKLKQF